MRINVRLNERSIDNAIQQIEKIKHELENKIFDNFIVRCYRYFVERADIYLNGSNIGENVINDIQFGWELKEPVTVGSSGNGFVKLARFVNTADKAVFVEFGVGDVGERNPHKNAVEAMYEYNVPSLSKYAGQHHDENTWRFYARDRSDIDLIEGNYETWPTANGRIKVITTGSPSVMYAFNALQDLRAEIPKIWKEIKIEYWG